MLILASKAISLAGEDFSIASYEGVAENIAATQCLNSILKCRRDTIQGFFFFNMQPHKIRIRDNICP